MAVVTSAKNAEKLERNRTAFVRRLPGFADPMPEAAEFISGIPHHSDHESELDNLWPVVRAIASKKVYYLAKFKKKFNEVKDPEYAFCAIWPDTSPASGGNHPVSKVTMLRMIAQGLFKDETGFLSCLLNLHDGEARVLVDDGHAPLPDGVDYHLACFWHYQYVTTPAVRERLHKRFVDKDESPLDDETIAWILEAGHNRTLIFRWEPPQNHQQPLALRRNPSLISQGTWYFRKGNYVTLAELFHYGQRHVTCYHLYRMYLSLDIYIHRRNHPTSGSGRAKKTNNAKALHYAETGSYRLPGPGETWGDDNEKKRKRQRRR